jgi:hypothetical protein
LQLPKVEFDLHSLLDNELQEQAFFDKIGIDENFENFL